MTALAQEHNAINLAQGFPDFDCDDKLKDLAYRYMRLGKNQYAPMRGVPSLLDTIADKIYKLYDHSVQSQKEITITAGATQAIFTAIGCTIKPGDEVIVIEPAYDSYIPAIHAFGAKAVPYAMTGPQFVIDWSKINSLCNKHTRLIIINNPHNPSAQVLSADDLDQLWQIIKDKKIYILSDEVYEHILFDNKNHQSILGHPNLYQRSFITCSFGKLFHNTGWKIGYCVAPPTLTKRFRQLHQFMVFSVNTPIQYAIADYLSDPQVYLNLSSFFEKKRDYFLDKMKNGRFRFLHSSGSYFILSDYSAISQKKDIEFAKWLTIEKKVAAIPLSPFYTGGTDQRLIRFCFAKSDEVLDKAAERLVQL